MASLSRARGRSYAGRYVPEVALTVLSLFPPFLFMKGCLDLVEYEGRGRFIRDNTPEGGMAWDSIDDNNYGHYTDLDEETGRGAGDKENATKVIIHYLEEEEEGGGLMPTTPPAGTDPGRIWGFFVCLTMRMALVWCFMAWIDAKFPRHLLASFTLLVATVWFGMWATNSRPVGFFGGEWWQYMRPLHATCYMAAGILALLPDFRAHAWMPLGADVILAAIAWLAHHVHHDT